MEINRIRPCETLQGSKSYPRAKFILWKLTKLTH